MFTLMPLLRAQRDLFELPPGSERFKRYVADVTGGPDDAIIPLVALNPMGKAHVAERLDRLIAIDAEAVASAAIDEANRLLGRRVPGEFRVGLGLADDAAGGWTDRHLFECKFRFENGPEFRRGFCTALFWTGDPEPTPESVRREVLTAARRTVHFAEHGEARTLAERMAQEGECAAFAGCTEPTLDPDDLEYSREVIEPHHNETDFPVVFTCLYGDEAAKSVGYDPMGLSRRAGYAVAMAEAYEKFRMRRL